MKYNEKTNQIARLCFLYGEYRAWCNDKNWEECWHCQHIVDYYKNLLDKA